MMIRVTNSKVFDLFIQTQRPSGPRIAVRTVRPIRHAQHTSRVSTLGAGTYVLDYKSADA